MRRVCQALFWLLALSLASRGARGGEAEAWRQWEGAAVRLRTARIALLERDYRSDPGMPALLAHEQRELRTALRFLTLNQPPPLLGGMELEGYISVNDDSVQPFARYLPRSYNPTNAAPLLVFLHGYNPATDFITDPIIPRLLTRLADATGACVAAPFGRSNTDYQGLGEQDVMRVIDEMATRYGIDRQRVVLVGYSMGGLGAWCIAARHPDRFNGLLVLSGRGDFYVWHHLAPQELPPWQRRLVDVQFATAWLPSITNLAVVAAHGQLDDLVPYEQGRASFACLQRSDPHAVFLSFAHDGHGVFEDAICHPSTLAWFRDVLAHTHPKDRPTGLRVGETGSRIQNALLHPFAFVGGSAPDPAKAARDLEARADEWRRFAKGDPRTMLETGLETNLAVVCHLFVFGEPESSPLVRRVLQDGGVRVTPSSFRFAGRTLPRAGHGLWFTGRNPFNPQRLAIIHCGLDWGLNLSDNHRYDRIPDVICYGDQADRWGINLAVAAGYLDDAGRMQWLDPPVTPAILPLPTPPTDNGAAPTAGAFN